MVTRSVPARCSRQDSVHTGQDLAVCTLTDGTLARRLASHPRVGLAGSLATANIGIEQLVTAVVENSRIHRLVLCGQDSRVFQPGQSLLALASSGCDADGLIIGAQGHLPRLANLRPAVISEFRRRITLVDLIGSTDEEQLRHALDVQPSSAPRPTGPAIAAELAAGGPRTIRLAAGGRRTPIARTGKGYFVILIDAGTRRLVLRHYGPDFTVCREMTSHSAEALLLGAIRNGLLAEDDLSHAGYLGAELAKAETALRLGLHYEQDRPLSRI
jgi:tetrahydromethanopterin S-methyltransferase subunit A